MNKKGAGATITSCYKLERLFLKIYIYLNYSTIVKLFLKKKIKLQRIHYEQMP